MVSTAETLNLQFYRREDGSFEIQVKDSWSGHIARGDFVRPYSPRQLRALLNRLNTQEISEHNLIEIGHRLFLALCGAYASTAVTRVGGVPSSNIASGVRNKPGLTSV